MLLLSFVLLDLWHAEPAALATEPALSGDGREGSCITVVMPCQPGFVADPRCAARTSARLPPPTPNGVCTVVGLTAPGLSTEAHDWLRSRLEKEVLPNVCSCYEEGLSLRRSLRGHVSVRVHMKNGCGVVAPGGESLPDPFTSDCVRTRFDGFSATPRTSLWPPSPPDRLAEQLKQQSFVVKIELRPRPSPSPDSRLRQEVRCDPLPREDTPCPQEHAVCVISQGMPGGWTSAMWCRGGKWVIENERNLP